MNDKLAKKSPAIFLCILFHCVVLCIVCVQMCTVLLPPGVNPIAVNTYINYWSSYSQEHLCDYSMIHFNPFQTVSPHFVNCLVPKDSAYTGLLISP